MLFKEVIGQQTVKQKLRQTILEKRVSHAQLFHGNEGTGALALALAYAQYMNCTNPSADDACGQCASCKKYQKLIHPDLHFVFPVVKKDSTKKVTSDDFISSWRELLLKNPYITLNDWYKAINIENKQGSIYEAESDNIIKKLSLKSYEAEYKTMIIWKPDKMNRTSANRLLKLIEEPPPKTILLMVTDQIESILPTILSRTFKVHIHRIEEADMFQALKEKSDLADDVLNNIVKISEGNYAKALSNLEKNVENQFNFNSFQELMRNAYAFYRPKSSKKNLFPVEEANIFVDSISSIGREKQKSFLENALRLVREFLVFNMNQDKLIYLAKEELEWAKKFAPFINNKNVSKVAEELNLAFYHIERNGNPRIVFFDLILKLGQLLKT